MKGFKNTTKTQMGHGSYDEVPTRPATSKDVAAAKAVRIVTPSKPAAKPQPKVTDAMLRGAGEDKAPGERGAKRFAVGGPVRSGMPAQGKSIMSANDARTAPPMQNGQRPMVPAKPAAKMTNGLPQAWRDGYAADSARRLGKNPQPTARDEMNRKAIGNGGPASKDFDMTPYRGGPGFDEYGGMPKPGKGTPGDDAFKSSPGKPSEVKALPAQSDYDEMSAARSTGALDRLSKDRGYKKGGKVVEKGAKGGSPKSKWC